MAITGSKHKVYVCQNAACSAESATVKNARIHATKSGHSGGFKIVTRKAPAVPPRLAAKAAADAKRAVKAAKAAKPVKATKKAAKAAPVKKAVAKKAPAKKAAKSK